MKYAIITMTALASSGATSAAAQSVDFTPLETPPRVDIRWKGEMPCDRLFDTPVPRLPNGSPLFQIIDTGAVQAKYQLPSGGKIRVTIRETEKIQVTGTRYSSVIDDLKARKPFQDAISRKTSGYTVLADVKIQFGVAARPYELVDGSAYALKPNSLTPRIVAKVRVANWSGYANATPSDQRKWDGRLCESYHHELGHILVAAQILEEAERELLELRGLTADDIGKKLTAFLKELGVRIRTRQQNYHDEIESMGREVSHSAPYLELPFSWLNPPDVNFAQP